MFEEPIADMHMLVEELFTEIKPYLHKPFAFFGHSMGGLIAFSLLQKIEKETPYKAKMLFLSASRPPHLYEKHNELSNIDLINKLKAYGNTPLEVLESKEMLALILPGLRADYKLINDFQINKEKKLVSKVVLFNCESDISQIQYLQWQDYCKQECEYSTFNGGHFFISKEVHNVLNTLKDYLLIKR